MGLPSWAAPAGPDRCVMDAPQVVDALQDELAALTCKEEPKPSLLKQLPRCVFIALAQRYLTASQRTSLAATDKYAREELVTSGELAPSVWRVTQLSQADAVRMLSTSPPRAYAPLRWTSELVIFDSDTRGFSRAILSRYWQGLSLFVANAPALAVLRMHKVWRLSPLVFAAVAHRPAMQLEIAGTRTPQKLANLADEAFDLADDGRLLCSKLDCGDTDQLEWSLNSSTPWFRLWHQPALVELDISRQSIVALPEALVMLRTLRVLRANQMPRLRDLAVLARGPPALTSLALNDNRHISPLPARLACASSLERLELNGSSGFSGHTPWAVVKDMSKLQRLIVHYTTYDLMLNLESIIAVHHCFIPSVLEFSCLSLTENLMAHIFDALPTMSPRQLKVLEPALTTLERHLVQKLDPPVLDHSNQWSMSMSNRVTDTDFIQKNGDRKEAMRNFVVAFRAAVGGDSPASLCHRPGRLVRRWRLPGREDGYPGWASGVMALPMDGVKGSERPGSPTMSFTPPSYAPIREKTDEFKTIDDVYYEENVYHAITFMPAYSGKSFEELRLEDYQVAAMRGDNDALTAANAAFAAVAAERDRLAAPRFRAPSPVAEPLVRDEPFVFGAPSPIAEPRVSDEPFVFGASR